MVAKSNKKINYLKFLYKAQINALNDIYIKYTFILNALKISQNALKLS